MADDVHRLAGSSGQERGGLMIMKKKKPSDDNESMAPPKKSMLGSYMITCLQSVLTYFWVLARV